MKFRYHYVPHLIIVFLFIYSIINSIIMYNAFGNGVKETILIVESYFKGTLLLVLPFVAIFIKKDIGFVFILQYF